MNKKEKETERTLIRKAGVFVHEARTAKNLTQKNLNTRSGVSLAVIADLENGKSMPRVISLVKLCEALEVGFDTLLASLMSSKVSVGLPTVLAEEGFNQHQVRQIMHYIEYIRRS